MASSRPVEALRRAVEIAGGQSELARRIGGRCKQQNVWSWLNVTRQPAAEYVLDIERATGGQVSRHDLRPDLYPEPEEAASP